MKAVRLHAYREPPTVDEVAEPEITGPHDVIVRVGGAGLCRTDLHMRDGWFVDVVPVNLPLTLGHETAGWVHAAGPAVEHVAVGDTVICHPNISCGTCPACQAGQTMRCVKGLNFPGMTRDGGFAELVKSAARAVLPLDPRVEPADWRCRPAVAGSWHSRAKLWSLTTSWSLSTLDRNHCTRCTWRCWPPLLSSAPASPVRAFASHCGGGSWLQQDHGHSRRRTILSCRHR